MKEEELKKRIDEVILIGIVVGFILGELSILCFLKVGGII